MTISEEILALQEALGPKRIKTPNIEVEQFELKDLVQAAQKNSSVYPTFDLFNVAIAVPKNPGPCDTNYNCNCTR